MSGKYDNASIFFRRYEFSETILIVTVRELRKCGKYQAFGR